MTALYQTAVKSFALAMLVLAGGCMGDQNPVRDAFAGVGAGPPQAQTPEFVQQSRRANLDYIPVGPRPPGNRGPHQGRGEGSRSGTRIPARPQRSRPVCGHSGRVHSGAGADLRGTGPQAPAAQNAL